MAFGRYAAAFITTTPSAVLVKSLAIGAVVVLAIVNELPLASVALVVIAVLSFIAEAPYRGWTGRTISLDF